MGEHVSWVVALPLTHTGSDPLHLPLHSRLACTLELHLHHFTLVWDAAAFVCADAAVTRSELLTARAARQLQGLRRSSLKLGLARFSCRHL